MPRGVSVEGEFVTRWSALVPVLASLGKTAAAAAAAAVAASASTSAAGGGVGLGES